MCFLGAIGHFLDWKDIHESRDWKISLAFAVIGSILVFCSANWIKTLFYGLVAIVAFGILGAITGHTLAGLPILVPCAIIAGVILVWKGERLR